MNYWIIEYWIITNVALIENKKRAPRKLWEAIIDVIAVGNKVENRIFSFSVIQMNF